MSKGQPTAAWVDALQSLPDSDTTVLIHCPAGSEPVWLGYHDGETWRTAEGEALEPQLVDHWAHLPDPPPLPWHGPRPNPKEKHARPKPS